MTKFRDLCGRGVRSTNLKQNKIFQDDPQTASSRHFYISQWYRDADAEIKKRTSSKKPKKEKKEKKEKARRGRGRRGVESESESEESEAEDVQDDDDEDEDKKKPNPVMNAETFRLTEARKDYLVQKINPFGHQTNKKTASLASHIDSTAACLIVKYLSSKRPFFNSFDFYLKQILNVLTEQSIQVISLLLLLLPLLILLLTPAEPPLLQVRSKALKCMALVVQEDPTVLSRDDMQRGVNYSFLDAATMVGHLFVRT